MTIHPDEEKNIRRLFKQWSGKEPKTITPLPQSGSTRKYFRVSDGTLSAIAANNPDNRENRAFIYLTNHFSKHGCMVPGLLEYDENCDTYLLQDLGDQDLFSLVLEGKPGFSKKLSGLFKSSLEELIKFQIAAAKDMDFSFCYPRQDFDEQSIQWDLNYFKYHFLKILDIKFDEQKLEDDFQTLTGHLLQADSHYFMYRDFQSRNVMIKEGEPWFIDYQGGRRGPLQYDLASFIFQVRAELPWKVKEELISFYLELLQQYDPGAANSFMKFFWDFVNLRLMQVFGAYGFRGLIEKKSHFLMSIPYAIRSLKEIIERVPLSCDLPELDKVFAQIIRLQDRFYTREENSILQVRIQSFSYKKGIPNDLSGNGGGHVFDCRALPNPGRQEEYRAYNGKDKVIINYLESYPEVDHFLQNVFAIAEQSIENYTQRGFNHLMISFGCTGGQHRSVYCAEKLTKHLWGKKKIRVELTHTENF